MQDYVSHVDEVASNFIAQQQPRVQKVYNNEYLKLAVEESPLRSAKRTWNERKREERRLK